MTNVIVGIAGYGPLWAPAVASWLRVMAYTGRHFQVHSLGKIGGVGITDRQYTMTAENGLVKEFLANEGATHLFMSEIDMVLPHDAIVKLAAMDKDLAGGVYFLRSDIPEGRGQPCLYKKAPITPLEISQKENAEFLHTPVTLFPTNEPFRVDCAGLGCLLIKRNVFEKVPYPWFDLSVGGEGTIGYGSDIYFSKKVRDAGLELWIDPTVQCGQIDYYETGLSDYHWQLENNPGFGGRGFIIGRGRGDGRNDDIS